MRDLGLSLLSFSATWRRQKKTRSNFSKARKEITELHGGGRVDVWRVAGAAQWVVQGHVGLMSSAAPLCSPGVCCFFSNGETSLLVYKRLRHTASTFRLRLKSTRFFPEKQRPAGRMQPPRVEAVNKLPSSFCRVWKGATPFAIHLSNILNNEDKL